MMATSSSIAADDAVRESVPRPDAGGIGLAASWVAIGCIALLTALPLVLPPVLPLADLGGHLGRYAIQLDGGRDPVLAQWYTFRWLLIPNLGVDLLVQLLGPLVGLEPAVRVIVFATAFLQAFGVLAVSRAVHGRITPFAIVALPLIYGHSFLYGFLNYTLSLGLLWCSLALWIAMSEGPALKRRWLVFAIVATVMWTCHLVGWALLCIAVGAQELMRQRALRSSWISAAVASMGPLSCLLVPWIVRLLTLQPSAGSGHTDGFFHILEKLGEVFQVFQDRWFLFDVVSALALTLIVVCSWVGGWSRLNRGLALAALATAVCVILLPQRLLGSFYADQRLIEPALVFALLAIGFSGRETARFRQASFIAAVVFAAVRLIASALSFWQLGTQSAAELTVLEALPRHAQMVTFRAVQCPPPMPWTIDRSTHLSGYAIARRHAYSNDQWDVPGAQLLKIHNPAVGPFATDGSVLVFETRCGAEPSVIAKAEKVPSAVPYLWVIWEHDPQPIPGWEPVNRNGGSILYRRRPDRSAASSGKSP